MRRKSYTVKEKLEAVKKLRENDNNISSTARTIGISTKMLRDWRNNEQNYIESKNKAVLRKIGSGSKPSFPALEVELKDWVSNERFVNKRLINYTSLREKAIEIANSLEISNFICSLCWINKFLKRNGFSIRKITSIGQEDNRNPEEIKAVVASFFEQFKYKFNRLDLREEIFNMDETPVYIDMMQTRTISFKGEKNTEVHSTGHQKSRLTVALTISNKGRMLKGFVILRGLKKVPKCQIPSNISVFVSKSGTMDKGLMLSWIQTCYNQTGPFIEKKKKLILLDSFGSHYDQEVLNQLNRINSDHLIIPPRTTSYLQPLDVLVNASFKASLKSKWANWMINGPKEYTSSQYRKKPDWETIFKFISESISSISNEMIIKAFELCGYTKDFTEENNYDILNEKLKSILMNNHENVGIYSSDIDEFLYSDENLSE